MHQCQGCEVAQRVQDQVVLQEGWVTHVALQARKAVPGSAEEVLFLAGSVATLPQPANVLLELRLTAGSPSVRAAVRSERSDLAPLVFEALRTALG